jgi:hypothetical protein
MTYPTSGGTPDPYQPQQPYGQQYDPTAPYSADPAAGGQPGYGQQPPAYGQAPSSGQPAYGQQPPAYGQPYGAPPPYGPPMYAPASAATNTLAILSLVFAFVFPIAGIVMGHLARKQIRETGEQGEGLATAGLWVSYIFTALGVLFCAGYVLIIIFAVGNAASNGSY